MIPRTYPSVVVDGETCMVVYAKPLVPGMQPWIDYIPVSAEDVLPAKRGVYDNDGALAVSTLTDITGKQEWVDYIPVVVIDAPVPANAWTTGTVGYMPLMSLSGVLGASTDDLWDSVILLIQGDSTENLAPTNNQPGTVSGITIVDGEMRATADQAKVRFTTGFGADTSFTVEYFLTPELNTVDQFFMSHSAVRYTNRGGNTPWNTSRSGWGIPAYARGHTINTKKHYAFVRDKANNLSRYYENGVQIATGTTSAWTAGINGFDLFSVPGRTDLPGLRGRLSQVRWTNAVRYAVGETFDPPTELYPTQGA